MCCAYVQLRRDPLTEYRLTVTMRTLCAPLRGVCSDQTTKPSHDALDVGHELGLALGGVKVGRTLRRAKQGLGRADQPGVGFRGVKRGVRRR